MNDSWRDARFEPVEAPRAWGLARRTWLRLFASAVTVASGAAFVISMRRTSNRCHQDCYGAAPRGDYGSLSYEPGHSWTHYAGSWQWSAQEVLAILAFVASAVALWLAVARAGRPRLALAIAGTALATWVAWVLLSPSIP